MGEVLQVLADHLAAGLPDEHVDRRPAVEGGAVDALVLVGQLGGGVLELGPIPGIVRLGDAGGLEELGVVVQDDRLADPGQAPGLAVVLRRLEDRREVVVELGSRVGRVGFQLVGDVQQRALVGVARDVLLREPEEIGGGAAGERGLELGVVVGRAGFGNDLEGSGRRIDLVDDALEFLGFVDAGPCGEANLHLFAARGGSGLGWLGSLPGRGCGGSGSGWLGSPPAAVVRGGARGSLCARRSTTGGHEQPDDQDDE